MKKVFLWIWLLCKRQLKNPAVIIFLMGMPIIAAIISNIPAMHTASSPSIGIVVSDDGLSQRVLTQLMTGEYAVNFYNAGSQEQLREDVRTGKAECGYIFHRELTERFEQGNYAGTIAQLVQGSEFIPSMAKEIVFSALFRVYAKDMAEDYVDNSALFAKFSERAKLLVGEHYDQYLSGTSTFHMKFSRLDTAESDGLLDIAQTGNTFPIRGILAILIYLAGLFGCVQWKMDEEKGVFLTLPYGFRISSRPLYALIPTMLFAISGEVTLLISGSGTIAEELWKMPLYIVAIVLFSWGLNLITPSSRVMVSIIPVLLVAAIVLCPIFVNVQTYVPAAKYLARLILPYYYLL